MILPNDIDMMPKWEKFVQTGLLSEGIREEIAESWLLCRNKYNIDAHAGGYGIDVAPEKFKNILEKNKDLIRLSLPIMNILTSTFHDTGTVVLLSSADDYILEMKGKDETLKWLMTHNFKKGTYWSEKVVGTNAMSLCIRLKCPVQTLATEHYCQLHHKSTCACAPIHDDEGNIIGALNITSNRENFNRHSLGMAVAAAKAIEERVILDCTKTLLEDSMEFISEGVLLFNNQYRVTKMNRYAENIFRTEERTILGCHISEIIPDLNLESLASDITEKHYYVHLGNQKLKCICSIKPTSFNQSNKALLVTFRQETIVHKIVNEFSGNRANYTFSDIITQNNIMKDTIHNAKKIASTDCSVLIVGESGTGKELFAHSIHNASPRAQEPFVAINCAALPRDLVESELFGYEGGAFTGAKRSGHPGKFELANKGTLFLDEIGELPIEIQSKLLRVLDGYRITRIGGVQERNVDVRIIAATNRNLYSEVNKNNFRLDLYYRINVATIEIPPLRKRPEDIILLANYFLNRLNQESERNIINFSNEFLCNLETATLHGNVRQLQNIISNAYYLCDGANITTSHHPLTSHMESDNPVNAKQVFNKPDYFNEAKPFETVEREMILNAIDFCENNITQAAKKLKISKSTMYRKMEKYNIR